MPAVQCPVPNCDYITPDLDAAIVAALLVAHNSTHNATSYAKVEKVKRPIVPAAGTSEDWAYFTSRWSDYVTATNITGRDRVVQLLECCDETLRKDLTRTIGGQLANKSEHDILDDIKKLAVREENTMVARVTLHNMRQDRHEPVRNFCARLRGQAGVCKFLTPCPNCNADVNYTDTIVRDVLAKGIVDSEIQLDLLGDKNQNMTLEEVSKFIEAKEAGKRSASRLVDSTSAEAASSSYRKSNRKTSTDNTDPCAYCGQPGHGRKSPGHVRKQVCSAYGHKCKHCRKSNHFESACQSKGKQQPPHPTNTPHEYEGAVFESLCAVQKTKRVNQPFTGRSLSIDHHLYDQFTDKWIKEHSKPQPFINLNVRLLPEDYVALGFEPPPPTKTLPIPSLADTGCQSCLAGIKVIHRLGLTKADLIPVTMKMHAANNVTIPILGAAVLRFSGTNKQGQLVETRQMTYITDKSDKLFVSRDACTALGIISSQFPCIGEATRFTGSTTAAVTQQQNGESRPDLIRAKGPIPTNTCNCPVRQPPPAPPTQVPFPPTESNRKKLQDFLIEHYRSSTFNTCSHQLLPLMDGPHMRLMINPEAEPVAYHTPIPVALHWQDEVKAGLDQDVRLGVIEPVPIGEPVTWCHRMVICAKKSGKPRRTVDLQPLNAHATRETHHTPSPFHQARSVPHDKKKTVFDAWNGYHSVPLHEDDRHYTTFITPWGRYRYKTAPQGYIASGDGYTRRYDEIVMNIPNKTKCIDDALLWSDSLEESFFQAVQWLDTCGRHGITLNPDKFQFGADTVDFAGFQITRNNVRPCAKYLTAISNFPIPKNITDIRSWFGLVNQVSYAFSMADTMLPFRELLKPGTPFIWSDQLQRIFEESKLAIISEIEEGVRIFDRLRPTCLATDWSKSGIGFWLFQKHCTCPGAEPFCCTTGWKVTLVGSRFTHAAESRYAPVEGEALAVTDALDKTRYFVLGCDDLIVAVDHKPLLKIFNDRSLEDISNARLRNLKEKTLRYRFRLIHIPGVKHRAADSLSRHPIGPAERPDLQDDIAAITQNSPIDPLWSYRTFLPNIRITSDKPTDDMEECVLASATCSLDALSMRSVTWDRVRTATASDNNMNELLTLIDSGLPEYRHEFPTNLREYFQFRDHLHSVNGVILYKDRIVIPPQLRDETLNALHAAHQGVTSMMSRAESSVFWPGITPDITAIRMECNHCNRIAPSNPSAPPMPLTSPDYPFQCICADFFHHKGRNYLVIVDRYSNWPIIERSTNGADGLISVLRRTFVTFGIPDELSSDGGPEFTANSTRQFLKDWGVHHRLSSVAHPHSNCRAEIGVKTTKRLIADNTSPNGDLDTNAFQMAILQYRNTPDRDTKLSPAMCVFGRAIKDFIPILPGKYQPHTTWRETLSAREEALRNRHMRDAERWTEHTKKLPPLVVGDLVRVQNQIGSHPLKWDKTGAIIEVRQYDQYVVKIDGSGRITLRNRKFLRKYLPVKSLIPTRTLADDLRYITPLPLRNSMLPPTPPISHDVPERAPNDSDKHPPKPPDNPPELPESLPSLDNRDPDNCSDKPSDTTSTTPTRKSTRQSRRPIWHKDYAMES